MAVIQQAKRPQGCKDCLFWIRGECHRHAPANRNDALTVVRCTDQVPLDQLADMTLEPGKMLVVPDGMEVSYLSGWPATKPDDWCGDFELSPFEPE